MRSLRARTSVLTLLSASALAVLVIGCSKPASQDRPAASAGTPGAATLAAPSAASGLGNLAEFRHIAADVSALADQGNLPAAKARIKDLEVAWDAAEAGLKPRAVDDWHTVDKALDRALDALRADQPSAADCKQALNQLLATMDHMAGKR